MKETLGVEVAMVATSSSHCLCSTLVAIMYWTHQSFQTSKTKRQFFGQPLRNWDTGHFVQLLPSIGGKLQAGIFHSLTLCSAGMRINGTYQPKVQLPFAPGQLVCTGLIRASRSPRQKPALRETAQNSWNTRRGWELGSVFLILWCCTEGRISSVRVS